MYILNLKLNLPYTLDDMSERINARPFSRTSERSSFRRRVSYRSITRVSQTGEAEVHERGAWNSKVLLFQIILSNMAERRSRV